MPEYRVWNCMVEELAKREGGAVRTPNGLPIGCIKHDGTMWEHEHGDHPSYMFPVDADYVGPIDDGHRGDYEAICGKLPASDDEARRTYHETHALIYTDGNVAMTMYETCYTLWSVRTGDVIWSRLSKPGKHRLTVSSLDRIRAAKPAGSTHC